MAPQAQTSLHEYRDSQRVSLPVQLGSDSTQLGSDSTQLAETLSVERPVT